MYQFEFSMIFAMISVQQVSSIHLADRCENETLVLSDSCSARTDKPFMESIADELRTEINPNLVIANMSLPLKTGNIIMECSLVMNEFGEQLLNLKAELDFLELSLPILNEHTFYISFALIDSPVACSSNLSRAVIQSKMQSWLSCLAHKRTTHIANGLPITKLCFSRRGDWSSFISNPFQLYPDYLFYECCKESERKDNCDQLTRLNGPLWINFYTGLLNYGVTMILSVFSLILLCYSLPRSVDSFLYHPEKPIIKKQSSITTGSLQTTQINEVYVHVLNSELISCSNFSVMHIFQLAFELERHTNLINMLALFLYFAVILVFKILYRYFEVNTAVCVMTFGDLFISLGLFIGLALLYFVLKGKQYCLKIYTSNRVTICLFFHINILMIIFVRNALFLAVAAALETKPNVYSLVAAATLSILVNAYCVLKTVHIRYMQFLRLCLNTITRNLQDNTSLSLHTYCQQLITYCADDNSISKFEQDELGGETVVLERQLCLFYLETGEPSIPKNQFRRLCESKVYPAPGSLSRSVYVAIGECIALILGAFYACYLIHKLTKFVYLSYELHVMAVLAGLFPCMFILPFIVTKIDMTDTFVTFPRKLKQLVKQNYEIYTVDQASGSEVTRLMSRQSSGLQTRGHFQEVYVDDNEDNNQLL